MMKLRLLRRSIIAKSPILTRLARGVRVAMGAPVTFNSVTVKTAPILAVAPAKPVGTIAPAKPAANFYPSARAERPIGIVFDELSRGSNPFSGVQTCGIADVTDSIEHIANLFNTYGLVKVKRVYSQERSQELNRHCIDFSQLQPEDYSDVISRKKNWVTGGSPVLKDERFWPYAGDPKVAAIVQVLLGENCFEFGSAVAAHYTARGLHRDYRHLVEDDASEYSAKDPKKRVIRVLHYCSVSGGALGYIPFSHNEKQFAELSRKLGIDKPTTWYDRHRQVLTDAKKSRKFTEADELEQNICWAYADPGDIIISNSAMLHCGEYLTGPRYFFVSSYAESNKDTLPPSVGQVVRNNALKYHEYMLARGFKGSAEILSDAKKMMAAEAAKAKAEKDMAGS